MRILEGIQEKRVESIVAQATQRLREYGWSLIVHEHVLDALPAGTAFNHNCLSAVNIRQLANFTLVA